MKRAASFTTIFSITLLVIIIGGGVAGCTSSASGNAGNNPSGSSTTPPKPTATVPPGFTRYDGGAHLFTIVYPSDWKVGDGLMNQDFTGPNGQTFSVEVDLVGTASPGDAAATNAQVCSSIAASGGGTTPKPATITINGQQWQQLDCGDNGTLHYVVETLVSSRGDIYTLSYGSPSATFAHDRTQYFSPMEQSFTYL